jgi:signal transduction histidine kinase
MSLRIRLTLYYTGFFAFALLLLDIGTFMAVKQTLTRDSRNDLQAGTRQILEIYNRSRGRLEFVERDGAMMIQVSGSPAEAFVIPNLSAQVFSPQGDLVGRSPNLEGQKLPLPEDVLDMPVDSTGDFIFRDVNGVRWLSLITPLRLTNSNQLVGYLQISRPLDDIEHTLGLLMLILLGGGSVALLAAATGVFWLSRAALAPIEQVAKTARGIVRAEDLGQRVPIPASQDELQRLTIIINELLGRLEALFTAQRRLIADVSHELRTPLAAMQGNLEVLARGAQRDPELLAESLADMRRETTRLIRMVNDLLLLAQSEAGVQIRREPVELDTLLLEIHRDLRTLSGDALLRIGAEDQVIVQGDRDRLKQALLNLGVNALQHTPVGGTITLSLEQRSGWACLSVVDTGVGIAAEDLPHIFDRFYRADRSRSRHGGGAGLGLAIVKWIAEAHGGQVSVASVPGQGSTFAIWLPLPPATSNPAVLSGNGQVVAG